MSIGFHPSGPLRASAGYSGAAAKPKPFTTKRLRLDVWTDVTCPACWVGEIHAYQAIRKLGIEADVDVHLRSWERYPRAPLASSPIANVAENHPAPRSASPWRWIQGIIEEARELGLVVDIEHAFFADTRDAHRLLQLGTKRRLAIPFMARLRRAHFAERADISDPWTLKRLASEEGYDAAEVDLVLHSDLYADTVAIDKACARQRGADDVPFFLLNRRHIVRGAETKARFIELLAREVGGSTSYGRSSIKPLFHANRTRDYELNSLRGVGAPEPKDRQAATNGR